MGKVKEDKRIKFTKLFLKNSLIDLLETKHISKISIKAICENADINRATFYAHYADQYDLLRSIEDEYVNKIFTNLNFKERKGDDPTDLAADILLFIYENAKMSRLLFNNQGGNNFQKRIMSLVYDNILTQLTSDQSSNFETAEFVSSYVISGCVGVLQKWFENDFNRPYKEVAMLITQLSLIAFKTYSDEFSV